MADWDGTGYGIVSGLQRQMAADALSLLELDGGERMLDIGCGDGYVTAQIADRLTDGSIVGIDPSPRMIEAARRRTTAATFRPGEVTSLTFDAEFDVVTSFNALHWVDDQAGAYGRIAAALRPGGRALVTFVCAGERRSVEDIGMDVTRVPHWAAAFRGFTAPFVHPEPDAFAATVAAAGLEILSQAVVDASWDFGSRDAFTQWCSVGFADWTAQLAPESAPEFIGDLVDRYEALIGSAGLFGFYQLRAELHRPWVPAT